MVRSTFAKSLPMLSDIGMNIMEMSQALKAAEIGAGQVDIDPALEVSSHYGRIVAAARGLSSLVMISPDTTRTCKSSLKRTLTKRPRYSWIRTATLGERHWQM